MPTTANSNKQVIFSYTSVVQVYCSNLPAIVVDIVVAVDVVVVGVAVDVVVVPVVVIVAAIFKVYMFL